MILYHGTTMEIPHPEIRVNEVGRDFGFAFYTTDIKAQAERWAIRKAKLERRRLRQSCQAVVNVYEWNEKAAAFSIKAFGGASMEWLDLVVACRSDRTFSHPYDIVIGKIANDNVGETVSYVAQGIMRKEDAIKRLKFEKLNNQIAFCTQNALQTLKFVKCYTVRS